MKLTASLLESNLATIKRLRDLKEDTRSLERLLVEAIYNNPIPLDRIKTNKQIYQEILAKREELRSFKYNFEDLGFERKFAQFFSMELEFLEDDFSFEDAKRELWLLRKESNKFYREFFEHYNYQDGLELLRRNLELALTSDLSYIRGLAKALLDEDSQIK